MSLKKKNKMDEEKVIQIAIDSGEDVSRYLFALTSNGRIFRGNPKGQWEEIPKIQELINP